VAGPGETNDKNVGRARAREDFGVSSGQKAAFNFLQVASRIGILDFPVEPIRTRRRLALAAVAYCVVVGICAIAWACIMKQTIAGVTADVDKVERPFDRWMEPPSPAEIEYGMIGYYHKKLFGEARCRRPVYEMIVIPAGNVFVGSKEFDPGTEPNEMLRHEVRVDAFEIDKYEVTNEQYYEFVKATSAQPPRSWAGSDKPDAVALWAPVTRVTFDGAQAYAKWADKRLPTEAEWIRAARGDTMRLYPWGNTAADGGLYQEDREVRGDATIGDRSYYGVMDMGASVAEWTADDYKTFPGYREPSRGDLDGYGHRHPGGVGAGSEAGRWKTIKCQVFREQMSDARCASRKAMYADGPSSSIGFRCVRSIPDQPGETGAP